MPTKEPRVNVVLDRPTREALAMFAAHRDVTLSSAATDLIRNALELEEDRYWSELAERRERETTRWVPFEEAWARHKLSRKKPKSR